MLKKVTGIGVCFILLFMAVCHANQDAAGLASDALGGCCLITERIPLAEGRAHNGLYGFLAASQRKNTGNLVFPYFESSQQGHQAFLHILNPSNQDRSTTLRIFDHSGNLMTIKPLTIRRYNKMVLSFEEMFTGHRTGWALLENANGLDGCMILRDLNRGGSYSYGGISMNQAAGEYLVPALLEQKNKSSAQLIMVSAAQAGSRYQLILHNDKGDEIGSKEVLLPPNSMFKASMSRLFPDLEGYGWLKIQGDRPPYALLVQRDTIKGGTCCLVPVNSNKASDHLIVPLALSVPAVFQTFIGMLNTSDQATNVSIKALDDNGNLIQEAKMTLKAGALTLRSLEEIFKLELGKTYLMINSKQPIHALILIVDLTSAAMSLYPAPAVADLSSRAYIPCIENKPGQVDSMVNIINLAGKRNKVKFLVENSRGEIIEEYSPILDTASSYGDLLSQLVADECRHCWLRFFSVSIGPAWAYLATGDESAVLGNGSIRIRLNLRQPSIQSLRMDGYGSGYFTRNLLRDQPLPPFPKGRRICTLYEDIDGIIYSSLDADKAAFKVIADQAEKVVVELSNIKVGPIIQDWTITLEGNKPGFTWNIASRLVRSSSLYRQYEPVMFFSNQGYNAVVNSFWVKGDLIGVKTLQEQSNQRFHFDYPLAQNTEVISASDQGIEGIFSLYTSFPLRADMKIRTERYLGKGDVFTKGGLIFVQPSKTLPSDPPSLKPNFTAEQLSARRKSAQYYKRGTRRRTELSVLPVEPRSTGLQLSVTIPDRFLEETIKSMYDQFVNGSVIADEKKGIFGNQAGGYFFTLTAYTYSYALLYGIQGDKGPSRASTAFGDYLRYLASNQGEDGALLSGGLGRKADDNEPSFIIALHNHILKTGDRELLAELLPSARKAIAYCNRNADQNGDLINSGEALTGGFMDTHCYFDTLGWHGKISFVNALYYKALFCMAELENFAGDARQAKIYRDRAKAVKRAFNEVFWDSSFYNYGGYAEWVDSKGNAQAHLYTAPNLLAIVFGISGKAKGKRILRSIDSRLEELSENHRLAKWGIPCNLYDASSQVKAPFRKPEVSSFGRYMNGGIFPEWTFWEIIARGKLGDIQTAYKRLKNLALRYRLTHLLEGTNCWTIEGMPQSWVGEPYLSTQCVLPAALLWGLLGLEPTFEGIKHGSQILPGWQVSQAAIQYMGKIEKINYYDFFKSKMQTEMYIKIAIITVLSLLVILFVIKLTLSIGRRVKSKKESKKQLDDMQALKDFLDEDETEDLDAFLEDFSFEDETPKTEAPPPPRETKPPEKTQEIKKETKSKKPGKTRYSKPQAPKQKSKVQDKYTEPGALSYREKMKKDLEDKQKAEKKPPINIIKRESSESTASLGSFELVTEDDQTLQKMQPIEPTEIKPPGEITDSQGKEKTPKESDEKKKPPIRIIKNLEAPEKKQEEDFKFELITEESKQREKLEPVEEDDLPLETNEERFLRFNEAYQHIADQQDDAKESKEKDSSEKPDPELESTLDIDEDLLITKEDLVSTIGDIGDEDSPIKDDSLSMTPMDSTELTPEEEEFLEKQRKKNDQPTEKHDEDDIDARDISEELKVPLDQDYNDILDDTRSISDELDSLIKDLKGDVIDKRMDDKDDSNDDNKKRKRRGRFDQ